jgi:hypothetical protein
MKEQLDDIKKFQKVRESFTDYAMPLFVVGELDASVFSGATVVNYNDYLVGSKKRELISLLKSKTDSKIVVLSKSQVSPDEEIARLVEYIEV